MSLLASGHQELHYIHVLAIESSLTDSMQGLAQRSAQNSQKFILKKYLAGPLHIWKMYLLDKTQ